MTSKDLRKKAAYADTPMEAVAFREEAELASDQFQDDIVRAQGHGENRVREREEMFECISVALDRWGETHPIRGGAHD